VNPGWPGFSPSSPAILSGSLRPAGRPGYAWDPGRWPWPWTSKAGWGSRKISQLYELAFGLEVTAGGLCQADARLAEVAEPIYRDLVKAIRQTAAVYADETGWRIGVLSAWLWVFTSKEGHRVHHRRSLPRGGRDPGEGVPGNVGERLLYGLRCQGL